jgi:hypothetical protein
MRGAMNANVSVSILLLQIDAHVIGSYHTLVSMTRTGGPEKNGGNGLLTPHGLGKLAVF